MDRHRINTVINNSLILDRQYQQLKIEIEL